MQRDFNQDISQSQHFCVVWHIDRISPCIKIWCLDTSGEMGMKREN